MNEVLRIENLSKTYGSGARAVHANDDVSLSVDAGRVVGLLGHNGAGKTTLVNQVVGLVRPDAGRVRLDGIDAVARPDLARRCASVQAQANVPISGLTPAKAIELVGRLRGASRSRARSSARRLIEALDLGPWARTPAQRVSGGVARLTAFAMCAVEPGRLVVLDEPTNDVDPVRRRLLWGQIRALADRGTAVLLVTHNVREAERAVDDLVVLNHGRVIARGAPDELVARHGSSFVMELTVPDGRRLSPPEQLVALRDTGRRQAFGVAEDRTAQAVAWAAGLRAQGVVERYALEAVGLEDVYVRLTSTAGAEGLAPLPTTSVTSKEPA
ncbi:ABC transporter ATP-binding protein [Actinomyces howellii]|uniref:Daunorubicin/doxorubicin resistance ATP-binding protein DrrA n=1 Tax=Actinomyces howellii TaxID=52771 RepID=A0A3S4V3X1_9ACTO|nr:ABC transporter ATP-binding protein [Actinomyces howellii]VEG27024.1 Daunorubicin/doxorubicin resistance ATP-binding protein DrrA [Actinomyces howellii]